MDFQSPCPTVTAPPPFRVPPHIGWIRENPRTSSLAASKYVIVLSQARIPSMSFSDAFVRQLLVVKPICDLRGGSLQDPHKILRDRASVFVIENMGRFPLRFAFHNQVASAWRTAFPIWSPSENVLIA